MSLERFTALDTDPPCTAHGKSRECKLKENLVPDLRPPACSAVRSICLYPTQMISLRSHIRAAIHAFDRILRHTCIEPLLNLLQHRLIRFAADEANAETLRTKPAC